MLISLYVIIKIFCTFISAEKKKAAKDKSAADQSYTNPSFHPDDVDGQRNALRRVEAGMV